jgi:hypothetical protein
VAGWNHNVVRLRVRELREQGCGCEIVRFACHQIMAALCSALFCFPLEAALILAFASALCGLCFRAFAAADSFALCSAVKGFPRYRFRMASAKRLRSHP